VAGRRVGAGVYTVKFYRVTIPEINGQIAINTKIKDGKDQGKERS